MNDFKPAYGRVKFWHGKLDKFFSKNKKLDTIGVWVVGLFIGLSPIWLNWLLWTVSTWIYHK